MDIFPFLENISPWWWVAFGIGLGALEMATMSFFLIWPGLAALGVALLLGMAPALSGNAQITVFAIGSIALTFAGRSLLHRYGDGDGADGKLNSRANLMIGRHAKVLDFAGPEGNVTIDGIRWRARWPAGVTTKSGETVKVTGAEGMTLLIG
ncbi:MAG: NfeD family protein [Alphaproteobacteria bacterium]|nr:NfeD family protein [Alphaproteobacteria bacterium]